MSGVHTTTWMGPPFYAGLNRDVTQIQAAQFTAMAMASALGVNNIGASLIDDHVLALRARQYLCSMRTQQVSLVTVII